MVLLVLHGVHDCSDDINHGIRRGIICYYAITVVYNEYYCHSSFGTG
jgi:hypothetical protein